MGMSDADIAMEFGRLLGPLRRAVLRRTRNAEDLPDLPEAQIELLRVLAAAGSATPREVAERLRIAPSTVSNLVRVMTASGLVERGPSGTDLRTVRLTPSPRALELLNQYDRASTGALREAVEALRPQSRDALRVAVPALAELLAEMERKARS
ncbi:helix-turn-helix domain-containing protein [Streptomyces sp. NPDC006654]|uniref:MarR family winged helix-turn-helix transcriptional regulator n=1 Tax=Streptomyces sp. NPDC006654 TaxID=3156897 RepID=UPI0033CE1DEA